MIPVYMINGFLDSGKTEFIQYTIAQPYFQMRAKTLLIVCEEGDIEYDQALLKKSRTVMELIEDEEDFTAQNLIELEKKHKPARILPEKCDAEINAAAWEIPVVFKKLQEWGNADHLCGCGCAAWIFAV